MAGRLITIEGGEGAGKTTQVRMLAETLAARGVDVLCTREPGGAPGAEALRRFLLQRDHGLSLRAEAMVHFAARLDHVEATIRPALAAGRLVLCDRFSDSTLAYQGYGLGHGAPELLGFIGQLTGLLDVAPALTLILDLPPEVGRARLLQRGQARDRYEQLDDAFHARVAEGYRALARAAPHRCVLIDADGDADAVQARLLAALDP
ncbi:dTMP kinase [Lichenicoccus sp.]|uniref:dTMP kinase n=1 Tax=Lichenicoccus sp. TaxID=2781899 RepID=UPI003D0BDE16